MFPIALKISMNVPMIGYHKVTKLVMVLWLILMLTISMKTKKAIKYILKHPDLFSEGEILYAERIKKERKQLKSKNKDESSQTNLSNT
jgi:hypothetical protein